MKKLMIVCVFMIGVAWVSSTPEVDTLAATSATQPPPAAKKWSWPWSVLTMNVSKQAVA